MDTLFLVKIGELVLKGGNRKDFERRLRDELKHRLHGHSARIQTGVGRWFVECASESEEAVAAVLASIPGIYGFARAIRTGKTFEELAIAARDAARARVALGARSFKVEARRSDKSFPLDSYGIARELGARLLADFDGLSVDVHEPDFTVRVEIRDKAYVYAGEEPGQKGLPVGSSGKGLLLLSGGIDSPVSGYLMALRGLSIEAVYFHAYPYTSREAWEKVRDLAKILARYVGRITLHTVPFTEPQLAIKKNAPENCATLFMRAGMFTIADRIASSIGANCLITGESLGQVASQTAENLRFTESFAKLPVLRPLIGTDKEDTIALARRIGSYETSILPYEDCCVIFSPAHPLLRADLARETEAYEKTGLGSLLDEAFRNTERLVIKPD
ncbi:MAG: tRNA 4-thiouridine(8) synthase ThiI [Spirochaetales bacterium]|nr:tRNA 4-thiouridine(8) synthase ThiI [Spirochaetales bacterium]